jgi:hypothetical protein
MDSKQIIGFILLSASSNIAFAACPGSALDNTAITNLLSTGSATVCVVGGGDWESQELHAAGGNLIDFKKGASDAVDPSEVVGSWSINGNQVTYNYGSGGTYSYTVSSNGGSSYSFCGATDVDVTVINSTTGC